MIVNDRIEQMKHFYTVNEVADSLKLSKLTVWRYINSGKLTAYKVGRDWRIEKKDFDDFLNIRRFKKAYKK